MADHYPKFHFLNLENRYAMCASKDKSCNEDTEHFILNKARNQDIVYFFSGQQMNHGTRRRSAKYFMDNFETVRPYAFLPVAGNVIGMPWDSSRSDTKETILSNPLSRCVNMSIIGYAHTVIYVLAGRAPQPEHRRRH